MSITGVLSKIAESGGSYGVNDGKLRLEFRAGLLSKDEVELLRDHRDEITGMRSSESSLRRRPPRTPP